MKHFQPGLDAEVYEALAWSGLRETVAWNDEKIIKSEMENAVKLEIPLMVEIGEGNNWLEAH